MNLTEARSTDVTSEGSVTTLPKSHCACLKERDNVILQRNWKDRADMTRYCGSTLDRADQSCSARTCPNHHAHAHHSALYIHRTVARRHTRAKPGLSRLHLLRLGSPSSGVALQEQYNLVCIYILSIRPCISFTIVSFIEHRTLASLVPNACSSSSFHNLRVGKNFRPSARAEPHQNASRYAHPKSRAIR